ncbi:unnamed protein product [Strongylus vulgaris]|uniref:Piwi domain-containing protein n=1 Tax=Strongylus vulgaris TaxID=40348 RepID=A0A3P7IYD7_STRVU|nr:unnamed protein product [Strongylus vulgaris]
MARESSSPPENVCEVEYVSTFFTDLMEKCRERGLNIAQQPLRVYQKTGSRNFEKFVVDAKERFQKLRDEGGSPKILLLLVINDRNDLSIYHGGAYGLIKAICDNKYGVASQVIDARTVISAVNSTKKTVYYNIALKINAKLGGVNQAVLFNNESALAWDFGNFCFEHKNAAHPRSTEPAQKKEAVMYVGIDVTHPTANSGIDISIASMVANFDLAATRYANEIFAQMKGKETVECFDRQFCQLMTKFREVCCL